MNKTKPKNQCIKSPSAPSVSRGLRNEKMNLLKKVLKKRVKVKFNMDDGRTAVFNAVKTREAKTPQPKVRKMKAWMLASKAGKELIDAYGATEYPVASTRANLGRKMHRESLARRYYEILPVTITYTLPKPSKKKTK